MRDWIKKALALALCLAMVLSLAACGGKDRFECKISERERT